VTRWGTAIIAALVAAAGGLVIGYWLWGSRAERLPHVEQRLQALQSELTTLQTERQDIEGRLQQLTKEEERLAQENTLLRTERTTQQLQLEEAEHGRALPPPTLPPK
jgi:uncharacterized protein HemX